MMKNVQDSCCQREIPLELLDARNHATLSDVNRNMGKDLAEVYLKTCTPIERALFGLDRPLRGPENLWKSPDKQLQIETVQALTHERILSIGGEVERKIEIAHERVVERAVADAEEIANFEAEKRIKFHVEIETAKLNEEWQKRTSQLMQRHEDEKRCLKRIYEDGRELLREFIERKCKAETEGMMSSAVAELNVETKRKYEKVVECALAEQSALFEEQMRNSLLNLELDERNRTDELRTAMDLQYHLLVCRHITELMHTMGSMKNEHEARVTKHKSGELKHSWPEFQSKQLNAEEANILSEIHRVPRELMIKKESEAKPDELLIIHDSVEAVDGAWEESKLAWIEGERNQPFVDIKWKRLENDLIEQPAGSFASLVFNRIAQPQTSLHPRQSIQKIASSIIDMVRKSSDEGTLEGNIARVIQALLKDCSTTPTVDVHLMPKAAAVSIKDSLAVPEQRVLIRESTEEFAKLQLLTAVDSVELLKCSSSKRDSRLPEPELTSITSSDAPTLPPYMKIPSKRHCSTIKATQEEWKSLEQAKSSVMFAEELQLSESLKSSIQMETKNDIVPEPNAFHSIQQKCRATISDTSIESLLMSLREEQ